MAKLTPDAAGKGNVNQLSDTIDLMFAAVKICVGVKLKTMVEDSKQQCESLCLWCVRFL